MTRVSKTRFFAAALLCAAFFTSVLLPGDAFARSCAAIIYEHSNYGGASQCLQEGSYNLNELRIGNDKLSSIKVRKGNRVFLFEHKNFSGRKCLVDKSYTYIGGKWNDITSSIIVE
ncbi:MAG: beta/gamma crystallin-related protein [Desulfovibrio sp.]|nr:beta/gamma crystallin-related protein [Desulfovibrio sp.]